MRLGLNIGYSGSTMELPMDLILEADKLGYHSVWTSEAYGSDAITPLAWIGAQTEQIKLGSAIMQMPARTPAMTGMTAITLDALSGGRMLVGLGLSGPQVVEGWHGKPYTKPIGKTREYVSILRTIFKREEPLVHDGDHYQIPYKGDDALGLGKPLKSILHGRADIPIYIASIGPQNVTLTAEVADGWLPIFFSPNRYEDTYAEYINEGFSRADTDKTLADFDIAPTVQVVMDDNLAMARNQVRPMLALYIGGMGPKDKNFYNNLAQRYGFEEAAEKIQDLYLAGDKAEAVMAVPDDLIDEVALVGPKDRIKEYLQRWQDGPINTLNVQTNDLETVRALAELVL